LKQAREERVVTITVVPPSSDQTLLERTLEERWGLAEAIIVPVSDPHDPARVAQDLAPAGAECLLRRLSEDAVVGMTWGMTVSAVVDALPSEARSDVTIVQINGGLGPVDVLEHSTELARRMAQKLGADLRLLPAPGIVSNRAAAEALRSDRQISKTLALAAHADVALVGLGVPRSDSVLLRDGTIITSQDLVRLRAAEAIGDVALRFITSSGQPLEVEMNERIIGLTLPQLRTIPTVIAVAGGVSKHEIVLAALRGELLDVLVTDETTAEYVAGVEAG
jgi:DNA-binding transcriptional regulator LsrR (DeoR family)